MATFKRIGVLHVALLALGVFAGARPALADGMVVSPQQGDYFTTYTVAVDGFGPNEPVAVAAWFLDGTGIGLPGATADGAGHVEFTVTPQDNWPDGTVKVVVSGVYHGRQYQATFHLVHDANSSSPVWQGQYYDNATLSGDPVLVRDDPAVLFNWGDGSPAAQVPADNFSARWTTTRTVTNAGNYTVIATADDGVRVWVDDQLVIDAWYDHAPTTYSATVYLGAGQHSLRVEYYEHLGGALISVDMAPA